MVIEDRPDEEGDRHGVRREEKVGTCEHPTASGGTASKIRSPWAATLITFVLAKSLSLGVAP